jgi:molybdate transport system permease protein
MDWSAFGVSLALALWTTVLLVPLGVALGRVFAWRRFAGKGLVEALLTLPLVLPPTVLGYYLLVAFGEGAALGELWTGLTGRPLAFTFAGLLAASIVANLPFAVLPLQRAFEAIPPEVREAAWCSGLSSWRTLARIELPLAWPGIASATVLTFAHTLGEFGVVLMVGGNIPGETRTAAIAIYDRVQVFDDHTAGLMSALLLAISFAGVWVLFFLDRRVPRPRR